METGAYLLTWMCRHVAAVGTLGLGLMLVATAKRNGVDRTHLAFGALILTNGLIMWWYVVANLHVAQAWREALFTWAWIGWLPYLSALAWFFVRVHRGRR